jgi:hypothetical protein
VKACAALHDKGLFAVYSFIFAVISFFDTYERERHDFEERLEKGRQAREAAEVRDREANEQAEHDRVSRLLAQVSACQQAQQIREYVGKVASAPNAIEGRAFDGERDAWTRLALAIADRLDPLMQSKNLAATTG